MRSNLSFCLLIEAFVICFLGVSTIAGQTMTAVHSATPIASANEPALSPSSTKDRSSDTERINALEETLRQQAAQLDELKKLLVEQQETIRMLAGKLTDAGTSLKSDATIAGARRADLSVNPLKTSEAKDNSPTESAAITAEQQTTPAEDRLKKIETRVSEIGSIRFSGDIRLRAESFFGLTNTLASATNSAVFGNDLTSRHRMRVRARLTVQGSIGPEFDWGLRFASGSFADNVSTNQTLTDFFNRKPFALDQAFVTYTPRAVPELQIQGGKFEAPWTMKFDSGWAYPEITTDNDLMVEGFNESYTIISRKRCECGSQKKCLPSKQGPNDMCWEDTEGWLRELKFVVWQLPFLERNSAFVRNANGAVNIDESRRGGRDLALYGGQVRAQLEFSPKVALNLAVADLYFSGTQFISPVQVFGSNLQLPVTITIPATATTPAQTVTTQVSIPRDLLVAGNANLGLATASNNATNRDGRLSSGFNLVDMIARLELKHSKRFPVALLLNFVTNTQTHDVIVAGPSGSDLILRNDENNGFWGEIQIGQMKNRGDLAFGYTFMRIEKDAVLTPFNMSDITQQSDMRGHRFVFAVTPTKDVTFSLIGIVTQRLNGLFGPFIPTPTGSLNRATTRLQFDTAIRF